ncbi:glycosyltransferase family 4 protein [Salinimonas sp. HHU 13199]|uniref:Glycosyltransferase family 4 protein n=1 Tax=Salinimonas profundi TaxID=2729140 RepID=A0ABR8LGK5_9ALTE|nr:glycosyltransferase [Salinimonas profundi]MBD3584842.1 glycosyltransferase family 4 protein [Salinimonas profundi]
MSYHLVVIGYVWPEPNSSAAGENMMGLLEAFLKQGWRVTFLSAAADSAHMIDLPALGIQVKRIRVNCSEFDTLISDLAPDAVVFDRFMIEEQFSWRVKKQCPEAVRIINTEDLHSVRHVRQELAKHSDVTETTPVPFDNEMVQREVAAILRSDLSLLISQPEIDLLTSRFSVNAAQLWLQPLMIASHQSLQTQTDARSGFTFIGNFRHAPNWDALLHLKQTLWPLIRAAIPKATLHVYGAYPGKKVTNLHNPRQGFVIEGWAPDAREALNKHKVMLAPLRFGAGVKGKLITAMQCQLPSITTPLGAEGIADACDWPGAVTTSDDEFVQQSIRIYNDRESQDEAIEKGHKVLREKFETGLHQKALTEKVQSLVSDIQTHRSTLFYQHLLWHQSLRATQYMSQWIEAKGQRD